MVVMRRLWRAVAELPLSQHLISPFFRLHICWAPRVARRWYQEAAILITSFIRYETGYQNLTRKTVFVPLG